MRLSTCGLLVTLACGMGLCWPPRVAIAQQPGTVYRIGFLSAMAPPAPAQSAGHKQAPLLHPFWHAMRQLGWREGQNIVLEARWADLQFERLPALATELVQVPVDLIMADASVETEAAKQATRTTPIVMAHSLDAVKTGLMASLTHPGVNVTGVTAMGLATEKQQLELLKELVPGNARIALLWCPTGSGADPSGQLGEQDWKGLHFIASTLGLELQRLEVRGPDDYAQAFAAARSARAAAVFVRQCYCDKLAGVNFQRLVDMAATSRLPAIYNSREFVQAGGLMSYGPSGPDGFRHAATYVDKILKGAKPADRPVEQVTKFELVLNLTTAQALAITIPPALLTRADEVIQ